MSSIPLFLLVLLPQQCVQNPSRTLLEIKNACKLWRNNKYMTKLVWGFPGRYQKGHSWGCSAEANLINFHDNLLFSCLFVFFPPPLFAIFWWCYNMFATVLCYVWVQRAKGNWGKKIPHKCVLFKDAYDEGFCVFSRSPAKIWEETWLNDATFDVMQVHGHVQVCTTDGLAVLFACDIPAHMFNAAQLHLHTCLYTSLDCAHMFDATQRRAWNSMCRLHEATCRISSTESGGWPEKKSHWHFFYTIKPTRPQTMIFLRRVTNVRI